MRPHDALVALFVVLLVQPALATSAHSDVLGANYHFTGIQETTSTGDTEPLFGQPTGSGDQLAFSPTFAASSSNGGPLDQTASQLQMMIVALDPGVPITQIVISESGLTSFSGTGSDATGTFVSISGFLTVLEASGPIPSTPISFVASFAPTDTFGLESTGSLPWEGIAIIDVASEVLGVTKAMLSLNNYLTASSEADSTSSISNNSMGIAVVPEPGTLSLAAMGLLGLALRARSRNDLLGR